MHLVALSHLFFLLSLLRWHNCFVQYSRHVLRHLHWTMPFPHYIPMYVESNESVLMGERTQELLYY